MISLRWVIVVLKITVVLLVLAQLVVIWVRFG